MHHFTEARRLSGADRSIVIMSGPFTQRGEPTAVSKQARTEMALHMGADVVIELPVAYAVQPAEWFAFGAVALLEATGVVDSLCFGSEAGTLIALQPMAEFLADESSALQGEIRRRMALGASFPPRTAQLRRQPGKRLFRKRRDARMPPGCCASRTTASACTT
nr:nucleotidyltransferase family protein [Paenibacillus sonchi]